MKLPQKITIRQIVEMLEVFVNFETKNRYEIDDEAGNKIYYAYEESSTAARFFVSSIRPLTINIIDTNKQPQLTIKRPMFFLFPKHEVFLPGGEKIGDVNRRFGFFKKKFEITDNSGRKVMCISKLPKIWTFKIFQNNQQIGMIQKKWTGFGKEMFTDADRFTVDFGMADDKLKQLILAAAFAIDLAVFEKKH